MRTLYFYNSKRNEFKISDDTNHIEIVQGNYPKKINRKERPPSILVEIRADESVVHKEKTSKEPHKGRKKTQENRWTRGKQQQQQQQQHFSHPWHLTSFKGHTGNVLDLDYSSNGKYLASCSDDDPSSAVSTEESSSSSCNSGTNSSDEKMPSKNQSKNNNTSNNKNNNNNANRKGLSRRQKKNRRSVDSSPDQKKTEKPKPKSTDNKKLKTQQEMPMLKEFEKLNILEDDFYSLLHEFILMPEQMFTLGFPEVYENKVRILKHNFHTNKFDNKKNSASSTSSSSSNSDSDEISSSSSRESLNDATFRHDFSAINEQTYERSCVRCGTGFFTTSTEYLTQERCQYHWGKVKYHQTENKRYQPLFTCCLSPPDSAGCTIGRLHVWNGLNTGVNESLSGFVRTLPPKKQKDGSYGIYALDCEMCYTVKGLELCKVTLVGIDGRLIYNHVVRPEYEVVDYNTRFSGISEKDMKNDGVKTLKEVQHDLLRLINDQTILIGHALDNDLRALKLVHSHIVDTSLSFPHDRGYPFKYSLKHLVSLYLKKDIQNADKSGHDSYEDAASCMELMLWKIGAKLRELRYKTSHFIGFP